MITEVSKCHVLDLSCLSYKDDLKRLIQVLIGLEAELIQQYHTRRFELSRSCREGRWIDWFSVHMTGNWYTDQLKHGRGNIVNGMAFECETGRYT